jgi:peptide/nickel transport system substrate-binding protein
MDARRTLKPPACWSAALLAFALIATACGGGDDGGDGQPSQAAETAETAAPAAPDEPAEAPAPAEPDDEPLLAPVDTTTTTTPPTDGDAAVEAPAEPEPQFGGTLRVAVEAESDGLNPAANNFAVSAYVMTSPVFDPVAYWDTKGQWIPYLAESFTPIDDGQSWQMKLREGVRFHDGTPLSADDVIATFNAQLADPIVSLAVRPYYPEDLSEALVRIDDLTVQFNPLDKFGFFPQVVTSQLGMIAPSEWLAAAADDPNLNQFPIGTGPFMIESRTQDEKTVLVRNPDYWAADITDIYLDRIEVNIITDTVIAAERVAAGDIDLMVTSNSDAILTLRDSEGVQTIENVRSSEDFAMMNTQMAPFDDMRARQALTFATDRDAYVELIRQGVSPPADTMFHPDLAWHNPDVKQETNMPERAGPLVEAYCADFGDNCTDGRIDIELQYSGPSVSQTRIAELLIDSWEPYFNVTEQELLQDDHILEVALGFFNVVTWRQFGAVDPDNDVLWIECRAISFISLNWPRDCDPERDALMYEQRATNDRERRIEIWHWIQENIRDSYTYIFFNHANWTIGAGDHVRNICGQTSPDGVELFCNNQGRVQLHQVWLS